MNKLYLDAFICVVPIAALIYLMTKKAGMPACKALPLAAVMMYAVKLIYFRADPNSVNAMLLDGMLTAWTPILIIFSAVFLFKMMELSGRMDVVRNLLNHISPNKTAQLMVIGWAFAFLIEGASGFGTPAALAAPLLVGLGFNPVKAAIVCLIMNSVPVSFGAVGTPTWFGLGTLGLTQMEMCQVAWKTALIHTAASLVIPVIALTFAVSWREIKANIVFIYISILSCVLPYLLISFFSYEFPTIAGGAIGLVVSIMAARAGIGLEKTESSGAIPVGWKTAAAAMFPIWGSILFLALTRIKELGIKGLLNDLSPCWQVQLGSLGTFSVSRSLAVSLENIFVTASSWTIKLLYIPAFIPFFALSALSIIIFKLDCKTVLRIWNSSYERMLYPAVALMGALAMVELLMGGGEHSSSVIIGKALSSLVGEKWVFFSSYLGALGAFFAGSNTVSNLTFGPIQYSIAQELRLDVSTILALQSAGGAMGNMVCVNNIVAVCSILGITAKEGFMMKRTFIPMFIYGLIAAAVGYFLL
ncbi:MAG: lactate permease [Lentisphaerae bacterium GWF2_45_14]|nr:MAG: lactate permease [Lentisphaerae bacterium GWF2_45_14]